MAEDKTWVWACFLPFHHPVSLVPPSTDMCHRLRAPCSTLLLHLMRAMKLDPEPTFARLSPSSLQLPYHRHQTPQILFVGSWYHFQQRTERPATRCVLAIQHP